MVTNLSIYSYKQSCAIGGLMGILTLDVTYWRTVLNVYRGNSQQALIYSLHMT